jgi:SnoaL-like protein
MDEQETRRLDTMDEREVARILGELTSELSAEKEYALRHEDYVMEMPQSGERIRGRENMRAFQEGFPGHHTQPSIRIRRRLVRDGLWVVESVIDYGGEQVFNGAAILELKDGKIWRDTRYYAEPFEAPEWRSRWVERMEP